MNSYSIFTKSLFVTCLIFGTVGCASSNSTADSDNNTETSEATTEASSTAIDEVVEISVIIGQTSGSAVAYQATLGSTVRIKLLNPDANDEFHLHGYDISTIATAGQEAIIEFTADKLGTFDLESHVTGEWVLTLVVEE